MSYGCYIKYGSIYFDGEENGKKAAAILNKLDVDTYEPNPGELQVYGTSHIKYAEEDYEDLARIAKKGSYLQFLGDECDVWTLQLEDGRVEEKYGEILWDHIESSGKIVVPLGGGFAIVAEKNVDPDYKEIFVYIRNEREGTVHQDLAVIGENYTYGSQDGKVEPVHGQYSVKVYADSFNENWTAEHNINLYPEDCPYSEKGNCSISPDDNECAGTPGEQEICAYRQEVNI